MQAAAAQHDWRSRRLQGRHTPRLCGGHRSQIKTTTPQRYRVRPNIGLIAEHDTAEVVIYRRPCDSPDAAADKFQGGGSIVPSVHDAVQ